jgi:hypothetical protein
MNKKKYLELSRSEQLRYFEKIGKTYQSLSAWDFTIMLAYATTYGLIKSANNQSIEFYNVDDVIEYKINHHIPDAVIGKNNYINGYKFDILDDEEE